jgi:hypothetical protein
MRASTSIYGSVHVQLFSVLFYIWFYVDISLRTSALSIFLYHSIYSVSFSDSIRTLSPTHQNSEKHQTRLVSFQPSYFDLNLNIFDPISRLASYHLAYTSVLQILATYNCSGYRRLLASTLRLHRDIDLDIDLSYTHLTLILPLLEGLLANSHLLILLLWCLCWFPTI